MEMELDWMEVKQVNQVKVRLEREEKKKKGVVWYQWNCGVICGMEKKKKKKQKGKRNQIHFPLLLLSSLSVFPLVPVPNLSSTNTDLCLLESIFKKDGHFKIILLKERVIIERQLKFDNKRV